MAGASRNILALDISFGPASACLLRRDGNHFVANGSDERPHSQAVMPMLESLLARAELGWSSLDMLAAGIGPGSFTGLRIAAATLTGINSSLELPIIELSSLAIGALQVDCDKQLHVIEDARAGLAYVGRYRGGEPMAADDCLSWDDIAKLPPASYTAHRPDSRLQAWQYLPPVRPRAEAMVTLLIQQSAALKNNGDLPRTVRPAYLISSQAERHVLNP